jgi:GNAT superfamily N-acetyltransferase
MPPSATLNIRFADRTDASDIFALIKALADYEKLADAVVGTEVALAEHLFGAEPCIEAIVAEDAEKVVGFALFFNSYSTFSTKPGIYLEDLFVLPEYRGQGVGKALLTRLAQIIVEWQWGRLDWSVLDWNQPAIDFYRRMGATILEETRVCRVTGDALVQLAAQANPSLRPAGSEDLPALFALAKANADFHRSLPDFVGKPEALAAHLFGEPAYAEAIVAEQENQIAGFALFFTNYSTFLTKPGLYIEDLFVLTEYRRQGWGQALLANLAQQAVARDCGRLELLVATWNQPAIAFYQQMGAVILEDWRICRVSGAAIETLAQSTDPNAMFTHPGAKD